MTEQKHVQTTITKEMHKVLRERCFDRNTTIAKVLRDGIDSFLKETNA